MDMDVDMKEDPLAQDPEDHKIVLCLNPESYEEDATAGMNKLCENEPSTSAGMTQMKSDPDYVVPDPDNVVLYLEEVEEQNSDGQLQPRCLICFYVVEEPSEDQIKKKLDYIYKTFNFKSKRILSILEGSSESSEQFEPPLCPMCSDVLLKAKILIDQLEEIQTSLSLLKEEMKNKIIESFELEDSNDVKSVTNLTRIRNDMRKYLIGRKRGNGGKIGRPRKSSPSSKSLVKVEKAEVEPEMNPVVLLEPLDDLLKRPSPTRTFSGRVVKRPKTISNLYAVFDENSSDNDDSQDSVGDRKRKLSRNTKTIQTDDHLITTKPNEDPDGDGIENLEDEDDLPDPEWSAAEDGHDEEDASSSSAASGDDDDEDYLEARAWTEITETSVKRNKRKPSPPKRKVWKRKRPGKKLNFVKVAPKSEIKKKTNAKIRIKVVGMNGEEFVGTYTKPEVDEDKEKENQEQQQLLEDDEELKIVEGSVVSIVDDIPGVRINCKKEDCMRTFSTIKLMQLHFKKLHEGILEPFVCFVCDKSFPSVRQLKTHLKEHGVKYQDWRKGRRKHICNNFESCRLEFRTSADLQVHIRTVHTHETPFKCPGCETSFVSATKRECHIEQHHYEIPPLKCDFCPRSYFRQHRLRDHVKSHTGEKSYLCEICSKSFSQPAYLRYHQTTHKELSLEPYRCTHCEKTFATPVNLRIHMTTQHENNYRYHCEICSHGATHKSHLKLHMRTHSGERPHICEHCEKSFTRASQLKIHVRSHTGERPYICKTCQKTFTNSSKLRRHELIHSVEKPYKCELCDKGFSQLSNLNSHVKCTHQNKKAKKIQLQNLAEQHQQEQNPHQQEGQIIHIQHHPHLKDDEELTLVGHHQETVEYVMQPIHQHQIFAQGLEGPFLQMVSTGDLEEPGYQEFIIIPSLDANFTTK